MVIGAYLWPCFLMVLLVSGWAAQDSKEAEGASWWSLQPLKRVELPSAYDQSLNPVDAFIGQTLEKAGLEPSPTADRKTLIRRLSYDLLGLASFSFNVCTPLSRTSRCASMVSMTRCPPGVKV